MMWKLIWQQFRLFGYQQVNATCSRTKIKVKMKSKVKFDQIKNKDPKYKKIEDPQHSKPVIVLILRTVLEKMYCLRFLSFFSCCWLIICLIRAVLFVFLPSFLLIPPEVFLATLMTLFNIFWQFSCSFFRVSIVFFSTTRIYDFIVFFLILGSILFCLIGIFSTIINAHYFLVPVTQFNF